MRKFKKVILTLILIPVIAFLWLGVTESGLNWLYHQSKSYLPEDLKFTKLKGQLFDSITITKLEYKKNDVLYKADKVIINWSVSSLLLSRININKLQVNRLKIFLKNSNNPTSTEKSTLPEFHSPWQISLNNININEIYLQENNKSFLVDSIKIKASTLFDKLTINKLSIKTKLHNLNIKGNIQLTGNYQHKLKVFWQTQLSSGMPVTGNGNIEGDFLVTTINQNISQPLQSTINLEIINLLNQPKWKASLQAPQIDTGKFTNKIPPLLTNLILEGDGNLQNANLNGKIDGKYSESGQPLNAHLTLNLKQLKTGFDISQFQLVAEGLQLDIKGKITEQLKLDWAFSAVDLAKIHPQMSGEILSKGLITGKYDSPILNASYTAKSLSFTDYAINFLDGNISTELFNWKNTKLNIHSTNLRINDYPLKELKITADTQQIEIHAKNNILNAQITAKGKIIQNGWQGQIKRVNIQSKEFSNWKLTTPIALKFDNDNFTMEPPCWTSMIDRKICASLTKNNQQWLSELSLVKIPLTTLSPWISSDISLSGNANASAKIQFTMPNQLSGEAKILLPSGSISYTLLGGEYEKWNYQSGGLTLFLDEKGLKTETNISINKDDVFNLKADFPDIQLLGKVNPNQRIQLEAQATIHNLGIIEVIIPEVQNIQGEANLNLTVNGTLAQPKISGHATLAKGSLQIPRLGLAINQINLTSNTDNFENLNFHVKAHSGDGNLIINGKTLLDRTTGWPTDIRIKGEQFEVSKIPEARVHVSPDIKLNIQKNKIDIKGDLHIPYAKLQPKDITTAKRVSQDVTIIGSEYKKDTPWPVSTKIRVTLGDRVYFYGYGFDGRFNGSLFLEDEPGELTKATGEINIPEGKYQAYGQNLTVEHGRLIYTRSPVTNPGLDIRAVRIVNDITAGLKVSGNLNKPQIVLFSIPAMEQTNILSYLLMGAPIEKASGEDSAMMAKAALALGLSGGDSIARKLGDEFGLDQMRIESNEKGDQASLVMGRYLSPRLYISYGVGLIESFNTFTVRYQISNKWQIKAESGEHQGADILYTIEP